MPVTAPGGVFRLRHTYSSSKLLPWVIIRTQLVKKSIWVCLTWVAGWRTLVPPDSWFLSNSLFPPHPYSLPLFALHGGRPGGHSSHPGSRGESSLPWWSLPPRGARPPLLVVPEKQHDRKPLLSSSGCPQQRPSGWPTSARLASRHCPRREHLPAFVWL